MALAFFPPGRLKEGRRKKTCPVCLGTEGPDLVGTLICDSHSQLMGLCSRVSRLVRVQVLLFVSSQEFGGGEGDVTT